MTTAPAPRPVGLSFTERMTGFMLLGTDADFTELEARPLAGAGHFEFTVKVETQDLDKLLAGPSHAANLTGTVTAPALAPTPMTMTNGVFTLFAEDPEQVETRNMGYRFHLVGSDGRPWYVQGAKKIRDKSLLDVWHDTTTLYLTLYEGTDALGPVAGRGIIRIELGDFLKELTTLRISHAASKAEEMAATARFGHAFAGVLWQHYGGIFTGPTAFNPAAAPRRRRPLRTPPAEFHPFVTADQVQLLLKRYRGGGKGPVILSPGLGVSSGIFAMDTTETNLLEFLVERGYDVWLLDFRNSIDLPASRQQSDGEQVALLDYPAAVAQVRAVTGAESVQFVVHCWGATTFFMAMLAGLPGVRSFVSSQIGLHFYSPPDVSLKTGLHVPEIFDALGIKSLDAQATTTENWWQKAFDRALQLPAMVVAQGQCHSATCHRITFMYASLYNHAQLNEATHECLHEVFGAANMRSFEHIAAIGRAHRLVDFAGQDTYLPHLERLNLPIAFIQGAENHCFLPRGTEETYDLLCARFGAAQYARHVIPAYGHIDCLFGKNAATDVFPHIIAHLDKTN